tara:strand:- start:284 stop:469 length:186 start_codon:yes stop_codon:yes gene_type:complete
MIPKINPIYLLVCLVVVLFAVTSNMAFEDELAERDLYCDMVEKGHWPDYKGIAQEECEPEE